MNRIFTLLIALLCLNIAPVTAQIEDGGIGPDFTITDLDGNEHNLYDHLNNGETVLLDLFATWCGPCWSFHESKAVADAFEVFGPDGTNEFFAFAIESDASTNIECLYGPSGCNNITIGNWVEGVPYPVADNRTVYNDYGTGFFPTIMVVYPDRTVYELTNRSYDGIATMLANKPQLASGLSPDLLEVEVLSGSYCTPQESDFKYVVNNKGQETITSAEVTVTVNGEMRYEESWSGDVKSWGIVTEVVVPDLVIDENSVIEFRMDNINGDPTASFAHSSEVVIEVGSIVTVTVNTDADAGNGFSIINISPNGIDFIANETMNEPFKKYTFEYELTDLSCYLMEITDSGGNGTEGSIEVKDNIGNIIFNNADFGSIAELGFNVSQNTGVNDIITDVNMHLSPNPVTDILNVELALESAKQLNLTITSLQGKVMHEQSLYNLKNGINNLNLDLGELNAGLYLLNINDGQGNLTTKFVKQ